MCIWVVFLVKITFSLILIPVFLEQYYLYPGSDLNEGDKVPGTKI